MGLAAAGGTREAPDVEAGASMSIGFMRRLRYTERSESDPFVEAIAMVATVGMSRIPPSVWYGTEIGASLDVQYHVALGAQRERYVIAGRPTWRVSPPGTIVRFPALLGMLTPAAGVIVDAPLHGGDPRPRQAGLYLAPQAFCLDVLIAPHLAVAFDSYVPIVVPLAGGPATIAPTASIGLLTR